MALGFPRATWLLPLGDSSEDFDCLLYECAHSVAAANGGRICSTEEQTSSDMVAEVVVAFCLIDPSMAGVGDIVFQVCLEVLAEVLEFAVDGEEGFDAGLVVRRAVHALVLS